MLRLLRREGEDVLIKVGDVRIVVRVCKARSGRASLGFDAPRDLVEIHRREVQDEIDDELGDRSK